MMVNISSTWEGYLRDWDRSLRAGNYPETTRYNYLLAATQLARYLADEAAGVDADGAADDPTSVQRGHIESFQAWVIQTRSASTALNKHKALRQFFRWLADDEEEVDRSPMDHVKCPKTPTKLIPVLGDADTKKLLDVCTGKSFLAYRDIAIIRLYYNTGARLSEVANLKISDLDWSTDSVRYLGKGGKERRVRLGPKTSRALRRYLRARDRHRGAHLSHLWLADRGAQPLSANGIKLRLKKLGKRAGIADVHAHRWRHNYAHQWKLAGGDTGDLMLLLGWTTDAMPRHYGASAAAERAQERQAQLGIGEHV